MRQAKLQLELHQQSNWKNKMNMICVMPINGRRGFHEAIILRRVGEQRHRPRQVPSGFSHGPRNLAVAERFSRGTSPVDWLGFSPWIRQP